MMTVGAMSVRRILFLDIDGVLNSDEYDALVRVNLAAWPTSDGQRIRMDPGAVLIGSTPVLAAPVSAFADYRAGRDSATRGQEIAAWLRSSGIARETWGTDVRFACLDDDTNMDPVREHWVACDELTGLTGAEVERAKGLLGL